MQGLSNCHVEIDGIKGEMFVSDNDAGRFMCAFVKTPETDFCEIYNACGFMVWTRYGTHTQIQYFPIKLMGETSLSYPVMREMWRQINEQLGLVS